MRIALAFAVLAGFFVAVLAVTAGAGVLAVYAFAHGFGAAALTLALGAVLLTTALGRALARAARIVQQPAGAPLTRDDQPALWRVVDELAAAAGTRAPDDVRLVVGVNAVAWEQTRMVGLRTGRRYLLIGLPLVAGLTVGELRAMIAHELGHYGDRYARLATLVQRTDGALVLTAAQLTGVLGWLVGHYSRLSTRVAAAVNRELEFHADQAAVAATGAATARAMLGRLGPLTAAWAHFEREFLALVPDSGRTPPLLLGFRAFLDDPDVRERLAGLDVALFEDPPRSPFDTHPPVRERIAAMTGGGAVTVDDRQAWTLLADLPALERGLDHGSGPVADWPEVVARAHAARAERQAGTLVDAARASGVAEHGTADEVLAALGRGELLRLGEPLIAAGTPASRLVDTVVELLAALVVTELLESGRATLGLDWSGRTRVVLVDGSEPDVLDLVEPAVVDPREAEAARRAVAALCDRTLTD